MSNQTSLTTNLNSELESSTETSTSLRENTYSEPPSVILQNDDSDLSQNQGFNSPNIELSNVTEDSTLRLQRIRDNLARQVRDQQNAEIELVIQELQDSLDRRHRRGSDQYADLTYDDQEDNYDVPQAPPMDQSMSSSLTTIEPLLPPISPIPIKEPKESVGLIDFKRVLSLDRNITGDIAEKFDQQSRQAEFTLPWQQCIHDEALDYIKMRVKTSYTQLNISETEAQNWIHNH